HHVEHRGAAGIRVLLQREPGRGPPALEPAARAAHRRVPEAQDAALQRLCRPGRLALQGHGSLAVLLMRRAVRPALFIACLVPLAVLVFRGVADDLGANPIEEITHFTGDWALRFLLITLAITPLRRLTGNNRLVSYRRMLGLFAFFYACLHFLTWLVLDQFFDWEAMVEDVM